MNKEIGLALAINLKLVNICSDWAFHVTNKKVKIKVRMSYGW